MCTSSFYFLILVVVVILVLFTKDRKEGFNPPSNSGYNACGAPCSVMMPQWLGRLDQGNGLLGDGILSGYNYYNAY